MINGKSIILEKVIGGDAQVEMLYELLKRRRYNISNKVLPPLGEHRSFVQNHPYRAWYLVRIGSDYVGTAYVLRNNCVGISLVSNSDVFPSVVQAILKRHKPLKEIKSVRPPYFYINVAPGHEEVELELVKLNAEKIQSTFILSLFQD